APRGRGRSVRRAVPVPSEASGYEPPPSRGQAAAAEHHSPLRLWTVSGRRPSMSRDDSESTARLVYSQHVFQAGDRCEGPCCSERRDVPADITFGGWTTRRQLACQQPSVSL